MASIVSKLARAAFATKAFPLAVEARHAAAIRVSPAGGPKSEVEEEKARPCSCMSEVAPHVPTIRYRHLPVDENALKSDEAMWAFYEYWCKYHGISRDRSEMERRFELFSNSARAVHKYNSVACGIGRAAMTKFSDWTEEEKARLLGGCIPVYDP